MRVFSVTEYATNDFSELSNLLKVGQRRTIMWLPKDERQVLRKYYCHLKNTQESKQFSGLSSRAYQATRNLLERHLLHEIIQGGREHSTFLCTWLAGEEVSLRGLLSSSEEDESGETIILRLTLDGLDLALKYESFFIRSGLWWKEYRHHWIWLVITHIVTFIGGILSTLIFT